MKYIFDDISHSDIIGSCPKPKITTIMPNFVFEDISLSDIVQVELTIQTNKPDPQLEIIFQIDESGEKFVDFDGDVVYV